ncbi:hypothetical protein BDW74DRAFT_99116 [Aspergillus multicolor]|uniref:uncharacterized protein n=1 Tax=Aspergillus multicolor TaxID=41759 RepID=UPI003CCD6BB0
MGAQRAARQEARLFSVTRWELAGAARWLILALIWAQDKTGGRKRRKQRQCQSKTSCKLLFLAAMDQWIRL